jgi:hypothetical protein
LRAFFVLVVALSVCGILPPDHHQVSALETCILQILTGILLLSIHR